MGAFCSEKRQAARRGSAEYVVFCAVCAVFWRVRARSGSPHSVSVSQHVLRRRTMAARGLRIAF